VIACGATLGAALALAVEIEHLAGMYLAALRLGEPPWLPADEMARVVQQFCTYGQPPAA
jgi:L-fuculose-phosphate aldolase